MRELILIIALFLYLIAPAQNTITWIGGTPGHETQWNEPKNWDANRLPDLNDHVVIPTKNTGYVARPMVSAQVEIASLEIQAGAEVYIARNGRLVLDGTYTFSDGISNYGGKLVSDGEIIMRNIDSSLLESCQRVQVDQDVVYIAPDHSYVFRVEAPLCALTRNMQECTLPCRNTHRITCPFCPSRENNVLHIPTLE